MAKKRTTIWIEPTVLKELKMMGVVHDKPVGDVIGALVDFVRSTEAIEDATFQRQCKDLLESALQKGK